AVAKEDKTGSAEEESPNAATLTIATLSRPGYSKTTMEFRRVETSVKSTVHDHYNVPTKERSVRGSLYPVYMVMTGKTHREPESFDTAESILKILPGEGISITEDTYLKKTKPSDSNEPLVRTLKLRYASEKQKR